MIDTNVVLTNILVRTILKARMLECPRELDALIGDTVSKLIRAVHIQDELLCEKKIAERYGFLDVVKLRNMRTRGAGPRFLKMGPHRNSRVYYKNSDIDAWIIEQYQLESFVGEAISLAGRDRK